MLSVFDRGIVRNCQGTTRRELLRIGSLALGGALAPSFLAQTAAARGGKSVVRDKAVVLLFLQGGPPQVEMFDPKLDVPADVRSCTGEIQTRLPGVWFGGTFPKLAQRAHKLAVVRSFASGDGGHNQVPVLTGRNELSAPMGAVYARGVGSLNSATGLPTNVVLAPEAVAPDLKLGSQTGPFTYDYVVKNYATGGKLGAPYDAFMPSGGNHLMKNLQLRLPRERFDDRKALLGELDGFRRQIEDTGEVAGLDAFQQQAYDVLLRGVADAFDWRKEDARTIERYDTSGYFRMDDYHKGGRYHYNLTNQNRVTNLLGKQMLLARRLCEAGCGFVTVVDSCWDFHGDGNNPPTPRGMSFLGPQLDHAIAAFLDDLEERGLSDKILLLVTGEMGRSPRKDSKNGGTGHHANLTPLLVAGGGLKMGQVIGQSDKTSSSPVTERYDPQHLLATAMQTMFDPAETRVNPAALPGVVAKFVTDGRPIRELF